MKIDTSNSIPMNNQKPNQQDPYLKVAKGMETQFLNYLLTQMRKSIDKLEKDSSELNYYQSLLDYEYAKVMSNQSEGRGLQKVILDNLRPPKINNIKSIQHYQINNDNFNKSKKGS